MGHIDFNAVEMHEAPADHIMPGDWFDTRCGTGSLAYFRVASVRYIDDNRPHGKDRMELTLEMPVGSWSITRQVFTDKVIRFGRPC